MDDSTDLAGLLAETDWLRRLATGILRRDDEAEDLVQDTLFAALRAGRNQTGSPRAFLATIARRLAGKRRRDQARRLAREAAALPPREATDPTRSLERLEAQQRLLEALGARSLAERQVLVLRYFDDLSPQEIARRLGSPLETVKSRLKRGLAELRRDLGRGGGGDPRLAILPLFVEGLVRDGAITTAAGGAGIKGALLMSTTTKLGLAAAMVIIACCSVYFLREFGAEEQGLGTGAGRGSAVAVDVASEAHRSSSLARPLPAVDPPSPLPAEVPRPVQRSVGEAEGLEIRGRVVDQQGEPVAGARVELVTDDEHHDLRAAARDRLARAREFGSSTLPARPGVATDDQGAFVIRLAERPPRVTLDAFEDRRGMGQRRAVPVPVAGALELQIELVDGVVLHGRVRDPAGLPIPGASVSLAGASDRSFGGLGRIAVDEEGVWRTPALPFARFSISAEAEGHRRGHRIVAVEPGQREIEVDLALERESVAVARLLDPEGRPLDLLGEVAARFGDKRVPAWFRDNPTRVCLAWGEPEEAVAADLFDERETVTQLDEARYELRGRHPGRTVFLLAGRTILGRATIGDDGAAPDIVADLAGIPGFRPRGQVLVVVRDEAGRPVTDYRLDFGPLTHPDFWVTHGGQGRTVRNAEGKARLDHVDAGLIQVTVQAAGHLAGQQALTLAADQVRTIELRLEKAVTRLEGRVVDEHGEPVAHARICVLAKDAEGRWCRPVGPRLTLSAETGSFAIPGLPTGRLLLLIDHESHAAVGRTVMVTEEGEGPTITLQGGSRVDFVLEGLAGATFTILDQAGLPVYDGRTIGSECFGGMSLRLPRGRLHAIVRSPGRKTVEFDFVAEEGQEVPVRFVD